MRYNNYSLRRKRFTLYILFLFIFSASFLIMPFGIGADGSVNALLYIAGICFWIGLIGIVAAFLSINSLRKSDTEFQEKYKGYRQIGIINFLKNPYACIADGLMIISLVVLIIVRLLVNNNILTMVFVSLFVFTFGMHCMLNGINYIYINDRRRKRRE